MYQVKRTPRSEFVPIRNLQYHVQVWGEPSPDKTPLVMVHGWMDVAASYQFVVDALKQDHYIIAPDWRGYGKTPSTAGPPQGADGPLGADARGSAPACAGGDGQKSPCLGHGPVQRSVGAISGGVDNFWFPDYMADLDFLLDHYSPERPVNLVGHSLGGNVVILYAGVRPERVRRLVNLEGFGLPATTPDMAPARYAKWMDELKKLHKGELDMRAYDTIGGVARRLMKTNPRLSQDKADWLAQQWACQDAQGKWSIMGQPAHKIISAHLYQSEEVLALYRRATMPVLAVEASDNSLDLWWKGKFTLEQYHERIKNVPNVEIARIDDAGHMMHHDQPEVLAALIERFIA